MSSRGSALSRALKYFREADADEARVAHTLVNEIMAKWVRIVPKVRKQRVSKVNSAEAPAAHAEA